VDLLLALAQHARLPGRTSVRITVARLSDGVKLGDGYNALRALGAELVDALDAAAAGGAGYADARAVTRRAQHVATKNGEVESVSDGETEGVGVRVLVGGAWGFACDRRLSAEGARDAGKRAVPFARASAGRAGRRRVELAPAAGQSGEYRSTAKRDPVD